MNEPIQPGQHPDADQLSAFMEHALPPHEREALLLHLAVCTECREVVALSLPPMEPAPATPERRHWFSGMMLLWPAAALATATLLLVYAHHATTSGERPGARNDVAQNQPPPAPATPPLAPPAASSAHPLTTARPRAQVEGALKASPAAAPRNAAMPSTNKTLDGVMTSEMTSQLPAETGGASQPSPAAAPAAAGGAGVTVMNSEDASAAPAQPRGTAAFSATGALRGSVSSESASSASIAKPSGPATPPPQIADATSDDSSLISVDSLSRAIISPRLPSGAAVLSIVERGHQMVAIDAKNAVFLSNDGGVHWIAVAVPWKSRAIKAELVSSAARANAFVAGSAMNGLAPSAARQGAAMTGTLAAPASAAQAAQESKTTEAVQGQSESAAITAPPASPGSLSGVVTDPTGAVVAGTTITAKSSDGKLVRAATSDRNGHYQLDGLPSGAYDLSASARGFQLLALHAVAVDASQAKLLNLTLQVGAVSEAVTVENAARMIDLEPNAAAPQAAAAGRTPPLFAITTDAGEHWTSADGVTWQRR